MRNLFGRRRSKAPVAEPAPKHKPQEQPIWVRRGDWMMPLHAQPVIELTRPVSPVVSAEDPAEVERRRLAAMDNRTRQAMEHDQREAERQAERDRAEQRQREESEAAHADRERRHRELQEGQTRWAATRDELRATEKELHDEAVRAHAEVEVALREGDASRVILARQRADVADELEQRAAARLAEHLRTQPLVTSLLR